MVKEMLHMECAVLMGANIANEVASGQYCEATIGKGVIVFPQTLLKQKNIIIMDTQL